MPPLLLLPELLLELPPLLLPDVPELLDLEPVDILLVVPELRLPDVDLKDDPERVPEPNPDPVDERYVLLEEFVLIPEEYLPPVFDEPIVL